jgi:hypothetical protein
MSLLRDLRARAGVRQLLSDIDSNPKVKKNGKLGVLTAVLHLAPANLSGYEVCPKRSPGCTAACLHFAGSPAYMAAKNAGRIRKTRLLFSDRDLFLNILALEIAQHIRRADRRQMEAAVRLNATSDIVWERKGFTPYPEVAAALGIDRKMTTIDRIFPTGAVSFYDYTAIPNRQPNANYHLTFSLKEHNVNDSILELKRGRNLAVVFATSDLPDSFTIGGQTLPVINGDEHDYRPADPDGVVVGLKVKGVRGRNDISGFVNPSKSEKRPGHLLAA